MLNVAWEKIIKALQALEKNSGIESRDRECQLPSEIKYKNNIIEDQYNM